GKRATSSWWFVSLLTWYWIEDDRAIYCRSPTLTRSRTRRPLASVVSGTFRVSGPSGTSGPRGAPSLVILSQLVQPFDLPDLARQSGAGRPAGFTPSKSSR